MKHQFGISIGIEIQTDHLLNDSTETALTDGLRQLLETNENEGLELINANHSGGPQYEIAYETDMQGHNEFLIADVINKRIGKAREYLMTLSYVNCHEIKTGIHRDN